ncbi:MAG: hypothetical protein QOE38_2895, partial [Thermoleophilaceae bacterium]|nr:hypothetical protein [Thermoleophilaceae bacterium]
GGIDCATGLPKPSRSSLGQCTDKTKPVTKLVPPGLHRARKFLSLKGVASDAGCKGSATRLKRRGRVESVLVSVAKVKPRHGCRFLLVSGKLEPKFHNCAKPFLFMAKGTKRWHVKLRVRGLPSGDYRAVARAVDASQNKERPTHRRNVIRFAVR